MLADLTIHLIFLRFLSLLVIAAVQGFVVAGTAVLLGDQGPKHDGRLTPLPFSHLDLLGGACLIVFGLGWTKPVAVDPKEFRLGRIGVVAVILAPLAALIATAVVLLALVVPAVTGLPYTAGLLVAAFLRLAARLCLWVGLLNLLPVPPLTGGHLLAAFNVTLSRQTTWILAAAVAVAIATGLAADVIGPAYAALAARIIGE